jgi:HAD superfamily hydrolase (TIGR01490 family)
LKPKLTLFDLDHTLLQGDSDQLWCDYLMDRGVLPREAFASRNAAMARDYAAGQASAEAFCNFYIGTLAGRSAAEWQPLRADYFAQCLAPRLPAAALALVARYRDAGDRVVLSTATCRFLSEPSAAHLGITELIATECELDAQGRFSGRSRGTLNMREGKVRRLHDWLAAQGLALADVASTLYSDSINDLPLLNAVDRAVAVDPDPRLAQEAARRGWATMSLR